MGFNVLQGNASKMGKGKVHDCFLMEFAEDEWVKDSKKNDRPKCQPFFANVVSYAVHSVVQWFPVLHFEQGSKHLFPSFWHWNIL